MTSCCASLLSVSPDRCDDCFVHLTDFTVVDRGSYFYHCDGLFSAAVTGVYCKRHERCGGVGFTFPPHVEYIFDTDS